MTEAAYVWMQELRRSAKGTSLASPQVTSQRERLLEIATRFEVSVRRIIVHLPRAFAAKACWLHIAARLHATLG